MSTAIPTEASGLLAPIRTSRNFRSLWLGQSFASLGGSILNVVLPLLALSMHDSTMTLGILMMLTMIPQVVLLPFAGLVADRWPRVPVMIGTDICRFALLSTVTILCATHRLTLSELYVFCVLFGLMQAMFQPAYAGTRAEVFTDDIRSSANALTQGAQQIAMLVGPSLGGVIVGLGSDASGLGADAIGFLISFVSLGFVRLSPRLRSDSQVAIRPSFFHEMLGGVHELKKHAWLWVTILIAALFNVSSTGIISVLLPWLVEDHLHLPSIDYGVITSASAVGALVMSLVYGARKRWRKRGLLAYLGIAVSGLALVGVSLARSVPELCVLMAFSGAGTALFGLIWEISLQELVAIDAYGRVSSLDYFGSYSLVPIGYLATGFFSTAYGGIPTMLGEATVIVLCAVFVVFVRAIRRFE